ncbi:hypothetical protein BGZ94_009373 [Podila epigama]|nr:hypothetical protein BGZ94_009373 [Podila epigama]
MAPLEEQHHTILINIPKVPSLSTVKGSSTDLTNATSALKQHQQQQQQQQQYEIVFRHGRVTDAPLMTELQFSNYFFHYSNIAPKVFLDNLNPTDMTNYHTVRMNPPVDKRSMVYVVAERQNIITREKEVIGMSQAMVPDWKRAYNHRWNPGWNFDSFDGEIDTLYVKVGVQGGGIGRKLLLGALQEGRDRFNMHKGVIIWTLLENMQAHDFYKRIGCERAGTRTLDLHGVPSECAGFAVKSIDQLIGAKH